MRDLQQERARPSTLKRSTKKIAKHISRVSRGIRKRLAQIRYQSHPQTPSSITDAAQRLSHLRRPDFIIIGAPKCGTSWLQRALAQHPSILMVPDEIEYFSAHLDYSLDWYLDHFARQMRAKALPAKDRGVVGEKSARYCSMSLDRIGLMHSLLPEAKLILMTRDPVARHWSQAKRYFSKRRLNKREGGVMGVPRKELFAFFDLMRPLSEFSTMVANWRRVYPSKQLLILSQEDVLARPREAYDAALLHLGAPRDYDPSAIRLLEAETNKGPRLTMPADVAEYLETMFAGERKRFRELNGS